MDGPEREADAGGDRMTEMEQRVARLEGRPTATQRSRGVLGALFPPDSRRHLRAAGREQLLAARSMLDHWIDRLEGTQPEDPSQDRERIRID